MLAATLATHGEDLARQLVGVVALAVFGDLVQIAQRVLIHLEEQTNARRVAQAFGHLGQQLGIVQVGLDLEVIPDTRDPQSRVKITQHGANVLPQLANELLAHRAALDGDFRENFDDQLHE